MSFDSQHGCNANIFTVDPKSEVSVLKYDCGATAGSYKVYNIGRMEVYAELEYISKIIYEGLVKSGECKIFRNGEHNALRIRIYNGNSIRGIVQCSRLCEDLKMAHNKEPGLLDKDHNVKLWSVLSVGVKHIPYIQEKFKGLLEAFWPANELNIWEKILQKLQPLVGKETLEKISTILSVRVKTIGDKVRALSEDLEKGRRPVKLYNDVIHELSGFEKDLIVSDKKNNMFLLPLFAQTVLMKTMIYAIGITAKEEMDLSANDLTRIKHYFDNTVRGESGASEYINNMLVERLENAYDTAYPEELYDSMMNVRSYIGVHGMELVRIWDSIYGNPFIGDKIYNDVISYSNFFGRQTPNLIKEATSLKMFPPLTPFFIGFTRVYLVSIDMYIWRRASSSSPKIGGMKLDFGNNTTYTMGTVTGETEKVDFKEAYITKLQVTGNGAVDSCKFFFSDGRQLTFGTIEKDSEEKTFELKGHLIMSLFLCSDNFSTGGQAANIAVSYRLISDRSRRK
ncbi:uncharacterized protein LOC108906945 [Anoplophora glabripennis]|uniref:uncharacterized protein LOC108906945 n=1 Tax=Anoplophora glabripennis TaxID=217634 RepID=UPI000874EAD7|nr:uncharacterized protein LOC108906945 [Anoplophora glabripennis]